MDGRFIICFVEVHYLYEETKHRGPMAAYADDPPGLFRWTIGDAGNAGVLRLAGASSMAAGAAPSSPACKVCTVCASTALCGGEVGGGGREDE